MYTRSCSLSKCLKTRLIVSLLPSFISISQTGEKKRMINSGRIKNDEVDRSDHNTWFRYKGGHQDYSQREYIYNIYSLTIQINAGDGDERQCHQQEVIPDADGNGDQNNNIIIQIQGWREDYTVPLSGNHNVIIIMLNNTFVSEGIVRVTF